MTTALENDNHTCENCYLRSDLNGYCLIKLVEVTNDDTCEQWKDDKSVIREEF